MTGVISAAKTGGDPHHDPRVYDEIGAPPPDGADLEIEPPDDDSRLLRLAEDFFLLAEDDEAADLF